MNPPTLAIVNGMVWDAVHAPFLGSILCSGGTITSVVAGTPTNLPSDIEVIDAKGGSIIPAFTDCHMHFSGLIRCSLAVDLAQTQSLSHAIELLLERSKIVRPDEWVIGVNVNENQWPERRLPTRDDLDVIPNPVMIQRVCVHKNCVNSRALTLIGETVYDNDASAIRDANGRLTGILEEEAALPITPAMKGYVDNPDEWIRHINRLLSEGIAEVHTVGTKKPIMSENLAFYQQLKDSGNLPIRVRVYWNRLPRGPIKMSSGFGDDWLAYGGLKIFVDGAYGARTAAVRDPFADSPGRGMLIYTDEELYSLVKAAFERDLQVMAHCLGDRGLDVLLDQIEKVRSLGIQNKWPVHPDQFERMMRVGGFCDVQARQLISDAPYLQEIIGNTRK
jgi:predicted amidohydrolase YtcJ